MSCHDSDSGKGDIILDGIFDSDGKVEHYKLWERAHKSVQSGEMPPKKKPQPSLDERKKLASWIRGALDRAARENAGDPGIVTMRRLTNAEYRHTVRELTGLWKNWSEGFVADGAGGEGFSNTGDVLFVSPEQLEKYLQKAREIASHASLLPHSGIQFEAEPVGIRSNQQTKGAVEQGLRIWYRKQSEMYMPRDDQELREFDYLLACWKWKYREETGAQSLESLAKEKNLNIGFLKNWWSILTTPQKESRYLALTINRFAELPNPQGDSIPNEVIDGCRAIASQRRAWYTKKPHQWASPQRMQQDSDGVNAEVHNLKLSPGAKSVYLLVSDLGDGNEGDVVLWSDIEFRWANGKWDNIFDYVWWKKNEGENEETRKRFEIYTKLDRSHPEGKEMLAKTFAVQAPAVVVFPLPQEASELKAKSRLEQDNPQRDKASVQWKVVVGDNAPELPAILPGELTIWHRLSSAHRRLMAEFQVMKGAFPTNFDKRAEQMEWNIYRWDNKPVGAYFLTNEQLYSRVSNHEANRIKNLRYDLSYVGRKDIPKDTMKHWDNRLLDHLRRFAEKAWRRPVAEEEYLNLQQVYHDALANEMNRETAAREVLVAILVSPNFLFRSESANRGLKEQALSQYEYASRLSYFLWSCPPDEALLASAREGKLLSEDWKVVAGHVDRMVSNYRSLALAQEFGGQWLGFYDLYSLNNIDREKFPEFGGGLKHLMYEEIWRFFHRIIQERHPITELYNARYTFLNEPLAKHYGIPGVKGKEFRYVDVDSQNRGGIFGMAGFHAKTSYPVRTSPVLRGDWILTDVLGRPTPPPPANVPELEEGNEETPKSLRDQLEKHREDASCASCHDKIDPLGFALEKFDPIGRWREQDEQGRRIDNRGVSAKGTEIVGIPGLRSWLDSEEDQFLEHFCTKLAGYALGREIGASDQQLVRDMVANMKKWNYTFDAAIKPLIMSKQFKYRRNF